MRKPNKYLFLINIFFISFIFFSCSKKEEQNKNIEQNLDSAKTNTDSVTYTNSAKISSVDVKKKFNEIKKQYENELDVVGNTEVKFSDFTGDGKEEAILYYSLVARGGNALTGSGLVIYKINSDKLEFFRDYNLDGAVIKSIKDGQINCIKYEYATGDPSCCPSKKRPFKLKYENDKISFIP